MERFIIGMIICLYGLASPTYTQAQLPTYEVIGRLDKNHPAIQLQERDKGVRASCFAVSGKLIALAIENQDRCDIVIFSIEPPRPVTRLKGHSGTVTGMSFVQNDRALISSSNRGELIRWNLEKNCVERKQNLSLGIGLQLAIDKEGSRIAVGDQKGNILLVNTSDLKVSATIPVSSEPVIPLGIDSAGKSIVNVTLTGKVRQTDILTNRSTLYVHEKVSKFAYGHFLDDCFSIAFEEGLILVFDTKDINTPIREVVAEAPISCAISPKKDWLAVSHSDNTISYFSIGTAAKFICLRIESGAWPSSNLTFAPDGKSLLTSGHFDSFALIWSNIPTNWPIQNWPIQKILQEK